ncbi:MAG TPA: 30S ribosomal protein S6 [Candidatus Paceibacterota bacterium]|nr:30S ribosomal protein S6 [Candidatus Paceibacterota bacterium]
MESEVKQYELICILEPHLEEADLDNFKQSFEKIVSDNNGRIIHFMDSKKCNLIYPINKQKQGIYLVSHISLEPKNIANISNELKTNKNVLRSLITILETPSEPITEKPRKIIKKYATNAKRRQAGPPASQRDEPRSESSSKDDKIKLEEIDKKLDELVGL